MGTTAAAAPSCGHVPTFYLRRRHLQENGSALSLSRRREKMRSLMMNPRTRNTHSQIRSSNREYLNSPSEFCERTSPGEVKEEITKCYKLIERLGRGVIYLGSSRFDHSHPHYRETLHLGREIANLLGSTTWTGAGPGLMDAATRGALSVNKPVGGFKISREAEQWRSSSSHPYLPHDTYLTCRFFSARKHGLVDAVVRKSTLDRTAVIALPGGIGTLDEIFEVMTLIQLQRLGSDLPVPFLLMNYDNFYTKLLAFMDECEHWGVVSKGEVSSLWKVCNGNPEALRYLEDFYQIPTVKSDFLST
ncbi:putative lysine decarboxylase family protein isoform X1 [Wolffia australiana]